MPKLGNGTALLAAKAENEKKKKKHRGRIVFLVDKQKFVSGTFSTDSGDFLNVSVAFFMACACNLYKLKETLETRPKWSETQRILSEMRQIRVKNVYLIVFSAYSTISGTFRSVSDPNIYRACDVYRLKIWKETLRRMSETHRSYWKRGLINY